MNQPPILINRSLDWFFLGGSTLLGLVLAFLFPESLQWIGQSPTRILTMNALVSYPHIIASFYLFYNKNGNTKHHPYLAWVAPFLLISLLLFSIKSSSSFYLMSIAQLAFVYFYWHFSMQAMGCLLWVMATHISSSDLKIIKKISFASLLLIGISGWISINQAGATENVFSMPLISPPIPYIPIGILVFFNHLGLLVAGSTVILLAKRYKNYSLLLSFLPLFSLYLWFSPLLIHSPFRILVQLLHGLQFFAFYHRAEKKSNSTISTAFYLWPILSILGCLAFYWIPSGIEKFFDLSIPNTTGRVVAAFGIFLNIHHYVVDGTLWKFSKIYNRVRMKI